MAVGVPAPLKLHHNTSPTSKGFQGRGDGGCGSERLVPSPWRCFDLEEQRGSLERGEGEERRGGGWGLLWQHCLGEQGRVNCVHAGGGWPAGWLAA